jgi:fumarate hydratase class II
MPTELLTLAPQVAIAAAVVGLVIWLQRQQQQQIRAALRRADGDQPVADLATRLDAMDRRLARVEEQGADIAVQLARLATDVRWLRRERRNAESDAPES